MYVCMDVHMNVSIWRVYHIRMHPKQQLLAERKCTGPRTSLRDTWISFTPVAGQLLSSLELKLCRCEDGVFPNRIFVHFQTLPHMEEPRELSRCSDGLQARRVGVSFQVGARDFFLLLSVQTGSGAHPTYPMGIGGSFHGVQQGRKVDHTLPPRD
jgi:hypothetical protein